VVSVKRIELNNGSLIQIIDKLTVVAFVYFSLSLAAIENLENFIIKLDIIVESHMA
jgi:hypothetical protein